MPLLWKRIGIVQGGEENYEFTKEQRTYIAYDRQHFLVHHVLLEHTLAISSRLWLLQLLRRLLDILGATISRLASAHDRLHNVPWRTNETYFPGRLYSSSTEHYSGSRRTNAILSKMRKANTRRRPILRILWMASRRTKEEASLVDTRATLKKEAHAFCYLKYLVVALALKNLYWKIATK